MAQPSSQRVPSIQSPSRSRRMWAVVPSGAHAWARCSFADGEVGVRGPPGWGRRAERRPRAGGRSVGRAGRRGGPTGPREAGLRGREAQPAGRAEGGAGAWGRTSARSRPLAGSGAAAAPLPGRAGGQASGVGSGGLRSDRVGRAAGGPAPLPSA